MCGVAITCSQCQPSVDEGCHAILQGLAFCFACVCIACSSAINVPTAQCQTCKRTVHSRCSHDGACTACSNRLSMVPVFPPTPRKFHNEWAFDRPWLKHDANTMWCQACREYPQKLTPPLWVQGTSNLKLDVIQKHQSSGPHNVSHMLWTTGGRVSSVLGCLDPQQKAGILSLFQAVYRIVLRRGFSTDLVGDAEVMDITGSTVLPGACGSVSGSLEKLFCNGTAGALVKYN